MEVAPVGRDEQGPARSAPLVLAPLVVLDGAIGGAGGLPSPGGTGFRLPVVIVACMAADPDHGVDGTRAAENLSPRPVVAVPGQPRVGFRRVEPGHRRGIGQPALSPGPLDAGP